MPELMIHGEHKTRWVTVSADEYESMKETIEVLSDKELVEQLKKSHEDIKAGRTTSLNKLLKAK